MKKKIYLIIVLSVLLAFLSGVLFFMVNDKPEETPTLDPITDVNDSDTLDEPTVEPIFTIDEFNENKAINDDYIGQIYFESELFEFPVLQGATNDTYISTEWTTMEYFIEGSIFMDFRNVYKGNEDQNLIIYGHYVYADENRMFGPLHLLKEEANYEANKYIQLHFGDEIRRYEIAHVYYCELVDDGNGNYLYTRDDMRYYLTSYKDDPAYFDTYYNAIKEAEFYKTNNDITIEDNLLTLQTCVRNHDELRLIVVAKEIERIPQ